MPLLAKMAELTTDDEQQLKDEIRILNTTISNRDLEITNILNRNELEEQEAKRHKAPTLVVTDQLVEDYVLKDAEIKGILNEIDRANQIMAKLRIMATAPDTLPEYQEYIGVKQELNQKLLNRKNELRPQIRKRLEDIANIKAEPDYITEENLVISRRTLEKYRDQLKAKTGQLSRLAEGRRKQELALGDQLEGVKAELEGRKTTPRSCSTKLTASKVI